MTEREAGSLVALCREIASLKRQLEDMTRRYNKWQAILPDIGLDGWEFGPGDVRDRYLSMKNKLGAIYKTASIISTRSESLALLLTDLLDGVLYRDSDQTIKSYQRLLDRWNLSEGRVKMVRQTLEGLKGLPDGLYWDEGGQVESTIKYLDACCIYGTEPNNMEAIGGPKCHCGKPSSFEDGICRDCYLNR